jgi:hypothetical protein
MTHPTGIWIGELVQAHQQELATHMAAAARERLPVSRAMTSDEVLARMGQYAQALAEVFAAGNLAPLRAYLEPVIARKVRRGTQGALFVWLVSQGEESLKGWVRAAGADPRRTTEALRMVQSVHRSIGLLVTEVNLHTLNNPDPLGG